MKKIVPVEQDEDGGGEEEDVLPEVGSFFGSTRRDHDDVEAARTLSRNKSWLMNTGIDEWAKKIYLTSASWSFSNAFEMVSNILTFVVETNNIS